MCDIAVYRVGYIVYDWTLCIEFELHTNSAVPFLQQEQETPLGVQMDFRAVMSYKNIGF